MARVTFTTRGYIEVWWLGPSGPEYVSRHRAEAEAIESLTAHAALQVGTQDYELRFPGKTVRVIGSIAPQTGDTQAPTIPGLPSLVSKSATTLAVTAGASTDNVGVTGYQWYLNGAPIITTINPSHTFTGLTPSTAYAVTVSAYDAAGNSSAQSQTLNETTNANAAPAWNVGQQELTTNQSYFLDLLSVCSDADTNPIAFSIIAGTLPTGLTFNSVAKTVSGTPTVVQAPSVTFRANDGTVNSDQVIVFNVLNADTTAPPVPTMNAATNVTSSSLTSSCGTVTDPTVANARTSGGVLYTFQRATNSGFTTGVVTEIAQSGVSVNLSGLSQGTQYFLRVKSRDAAGNESAYSSSVNATTQSGAAYVPSHYAAPFAQVAGATSDDQDMGATSWSNAANNGSGAPLVSPTTIGTAMRRATSSNGIGGLAAKVRCASGLISLTPVFGGGSTTRFTAALYPRNSGTVGNPIVFFAENPAATNIGSPGVWTELRRPNQTFTNDVVCPVIGTYGIATGTVANNIIFDGFYINEAVSRSGASSGVCQTAAASPQVENIEWRRMVIDRRGMNRYDTWCGSSGYNGSGWFCQNAINVRWVDCYVLGDDTIVNAANDAVIETYGTTNPLVEHCTFIGCGDAWYFKAEGANIQTNAIARYNFVDSYAGGNSQICRNTTVYQNVIRAAHFPATWFNPAGGVVVSPVRWYNNTLICDGTTFDAAWYHRANRLSDGTDAFYNNIIYVNGSGSAQFIEFEAPLSGVDVDDFNRLNHNVYYRADGGTERWVVHGVSYTTFLSYQQRMDDFGTDPHGDLYESDSIYANPQFVNYGAGNFRLSSIANGQGADSPALTAGVGGTPAGAYITGTEEIGVRANPTY